jgi:hypothetical protein
MGKGTRLPPGINPRPGSLLAQGKQFNHRQGALQAKTAAPPRMKQPPPAPPVYRSQSAPKVLQRKVADAQQRPVLPMSNHPPAAPPVYRPQPVPKVLQRKAATVQPRPPGAAKSAPAAPPVYRPGSFPKVLQPKAAGGQQTTADRSHSGLMAAPASCQGQKHVAQPKAAGATRPCQTPKAP